MPCNPLTGRIHTALAAVAVLALAACSDLTTPVQPESQAMPAPIVSSNIPEFVPGEVLVKYRDGTDAVTTATVASRFRISMVRIGLANTFNVMRAPVGEEYALAARLSADPNVEYAEPNYLRHTDAIDSRLWAFYNRGGLNMSFFNDPSGRTGPLPASYASILDADIDNVEGYAAGGSDVTIGSIDTGVDFTHPEFTGRLIAGKDWVNNDNDPSDTPDEGHGTHTTGTMAGSTVGVAGVSGAAPHVKVYVQRVCGPSGCPTSAIINAITAATNYLDAGGKHLVAINLSLGGTSESTGEKNAIKKATDAGILVIASAGNSGTAKVACPACDPNAISVSSVTWRDELASYSQYGSGLDISAPGGLCYSNTTPEGCIFSAVAHGYAGAVSGPLAGGSYTYMEGTSMAAPQVTGAAAAVASKTGLRGAALRTRLLSTADDKGAVGTDTKFGAGRLNVYRAVTNTTLPAGQ